MTTGSDLSVFWQEIIDSYRDIMVVKNSERAKTYLDLTDAEYAALSGIASEFTMARLSYHVSILESAMADMQRAFNSKRSIAEIALTRMCDAKSSMTPEALALRVDELEREISMLKLGVGTAAPISAESVKVLPTAKEDKPREPEREKPSSAPKAEAPAPAVDKPKPYSRWRGVIERMGELKRALAVQFTNSTAHHMPDGSYLIRMNAFFANMLASSEQDLAIVRGIIAQAEGISQDRVRLVIEPLGTTGAGELADELADNIDN